jgi:hypothetical protein
VDDGRLDEEHLAVLKLKLLALQGYHPNASIAIYSEARDLFNPKGKNWWQMAETTQNSEVPLTGTF